MRNVLLWGTMMIVFVCCQKKQTTDTSSKSSDSLDLGSEEYSKSTALNAKASAILEGWPEFNAFQYTFEQLYKTENREDLILVMDDLIEKQKSLESSVYPTMYDKPQIRSRQKVVLTYILKVKGDLEYRIDYKNSLIEMLDAYNALRNQFNVLVNYSLDTNLLSED